MTWRNRLTWLLIALAGIAYLASLQLPAIAYKPNGFIEHTEVVSPAEAAARMRGGAICTKAPDERPPGAMLCTAGPSPATMDSGLDILAQGWIGTFMGNFAWWANVAGLAALIVALSSRASAVAGSLALGGFVLGLQSFLFRGKPTGGIWGVTPVDHLAIGFYVWEASFLLLALSQLAAWLAPRKETA